MDELAYYTLIDEIRIKRLETYRLWPSDLIAVKQMKDRKVNGGRASTMAHDADGMYLQFGDCKLRMDYGAESRGWNDMKGCK